MIKKWVVPILVVVGGVSLTGALILWTNRVQFCRTFPNAPVICAGAPRVPPPPPAACGRHCETDGSYDCPEGLTCVQQYIYGGICLADTCDQGCWRVCRGDADCAAGLTCQHDPAHPDALGYCVGSTCPENRPCINGDGACDPTCEAVRNVIRETSSTPICGYQLGPPRIYECCVYGASGISCFINKDSDCEAMTPTIPPGAGGTGGGEPVSTQPPTDQPTEVVTEAVVECGPGWLPASGCTCCGTTLTCADGTIAEFNPQCMGGGPPPVCGDGVCHPSENVCGLCSIDCGPC